MFERRLQILLAILAIFSLVVVGRAFVVQVVQHSEWSKASESAMRDERFVGTTRGRLLDFKGRELAVDQPCIDAAVDYSAILFEPDRKWLRNTARVRLRARVDGYIDIPLAGRKAMLDDEMLVVRRELEQMWQTLARVSGKGIEELDETRRQIIRQVEMQRRIVWYNKFERARRSKETGDDPAWYALLTGDAGPVDIDKFEIAVAEQSQAHAILPNIDNATYIELSKNQPRMPGLRLLGSARRVYPYKTNACHVIGRMAGVTAQDLIDDPLRDDKLARYGVSEHVGREGLEKLFEQQLRGRRGVQTFDASGQTLEDTAPTAGNDVRTTLDIGLQSQIEETFTHVLFNRETKETLHMNGAAVVIDIPTGEVRAMVSYPTYDLNRFDELYSTLQKDQFNRPFANRATTTALEPGSTVKPIIGLGAITDGIIGPHDTIECTGFLVIGGVKYSYGRCWTMRQFKVGHHQTPSSAPHPNGFLTFADALERSCNVWHEELGDKLGVEGVSKWLGVFGLGKPTGVGVPESAGLLPNDFDGPSQQRRATAWFASIGQGHISATPMQMAQVAATIARDGRSLQPTLLSADHTRPLVDLKLNLLAVREAKRGMINVVNGPAGTGTSAKMPGLLVAGKTGSAQSAPLRIARRDELGRPVRDERNRVVFDTVALGQVGNPNPAVPWYRSIDNEPDKPQSHAWMIGFAPADNPQIAYAVLVEYGGGGGTAAGSVVRQLLQACTDHGYLPKPVNGPGQTAY